MVRAAASVRFWKRSLPKTANQDEMQKILERHGWVRTLGGKHVVKMEKEARRPITLPHCNGQQYSRDLTARIFKQAGLK
jgi:predicted RNA binding protein YcfA (HicA-like mRNA interferase family)